MTVERRKNNAQRRSRVQPWNPSRSALELLDGCSTPLSIPRGRGWPSGSFGIFGCHHVKGFGGFEGHALALELFLRFQPVFQRAAFGPSFPFPNLASAVSDLVVCDLLR